jgi:hypothetical protein
MSENSQGRHIPAPSVSKLAGRMHTGRVAGGGFLYSTTAAISIIVLADTPG